MRLMSREHSAHSKLAIRHHPTCHRKATMSRGPVPTVSPAHSARPIRAAERYRHRRRQRRKERPGLTAYPRPQATQQRHRPKRSPRERVKEQELHRQLDRLRFRYRPRGHRLKGPERAADRHWEVQGMKEQQERPAQLAELARRHRLQHRNQRRPALPELQTQLPRQIPVAAARNLAVCPAREHPHRMEQDRRDSDARSMARLSAD